MFFSNGRSAARPNPRPAAAGKPTKCKAASADEHKSQKDQIISQAGGFTSAHNEAWHTRLSEMARPTPQSSHRQPAIFKRRFVSAL
jgi:hypothetical protein